MRTRLTRQDIERMGYIIGDPVEHTFEYSNKTIYSYIITSKKGNILQPKTVRSSKGRRKEYIGYSIGRNTLSAARLIYAWFKGSVESDMDIDHIDNNPLNNNIDNLQMISHKENCKKKFLDDPNNLVIAQNVCKWARFCKYVNSLDLPKELQS